MSKNAMIPSAAALLAALVAAVPAADAGDMILDDVAATRTTAQLAGGGYGHLSIPTTHQKGYFIAILQDSEGVDRFAVEAEMSLFLPSTVDPPIYQIGGIYGILRPLPAPGVHYILPLPPIGYVEGNWRLQPNKLGDFKLQAYIRANEFDKAELGGYLHGDFQLVDDGFIHPPLGPPSPGTKANIAASLALQVGDFLWSGGFCGTNCNPPKVDGSSSTQWRRGAAAVTAGQALGVANFGDANSPHSSVDVPMINGSAQVQRRRDAAAIGAQSTLGTADFGDAGNVGSASSGISST